VITDSLVMKAIHDTLRPRPRGAVLALQAGADMVMALGSEAEQPLRSRRSRSAAASGALLPEPTQLARAQARLDALARAIRRAAPYDAAQREADDVLMRRAWARGLTAIGAPRCARTATGAARRDAGSVPCDGVSEAGPVGRAGRGAVRRLRRRAVRALDDLR
jgi:beta-N-acetylhexosaminidase